MEEEQKEKEEKTEQEENNSGDNNENSDEADNDENGRKTAVGVRFIKAGRIYHFDTSDIELEVGDRVVVDTARGLEMGEVVKKDILETDENAVKLLKPVIRKVNEEDIERLEKLKIKEKDAQIECERLIEKMQLPMKLISAQYNIDGSRLTVSFGAESRVDFRELVRDLSRNLKVRIEMRQVGPRDEAKLLGGYGRCGRQLCCANFLNELNPVSIKMAKEQGLPLSPMKISGICGRLLCCLGYEFEQYKAMKSEMPKEGRRVLTKMGEATVIGVKTIEEKLLLQLDSGERVEMTLDELNGKTEDKNTKDKSIEDKEPDKDKDKKAGGDKNRDDNKPPENKRSSQRRRSRKNNKKD